MIKDVVAFEWRYHTRQASFLAAALIFFLFGFALTARAFGPANVNIDSPYSITQTVALLSLFSVFVLAVFCANAVVRDRETRMEEIVFTTSIEKLPFLFGRFTGSFLAAFTAFSMSVVGMFVARFMPWHDADRLGALNPLPYLWALLVVALPNLFFAAVVLFGLSTVTRSVLASYAGSVLLYVLYFVAAAATDSPLLAASAPSASEGMSLAALLDPFGLSAFFEQTKHWTPAVRNSRLLLLSGSFLLNRVIWLGASVAGLAVVYRLFSFRVVRASGLPLKPPPPKGRPEAHTTPSRPFLALTRIEIRTLILNRAFLAMTLLWAGLAAFELISEVTRGEYGSATYPTPGILFRTLAQPLSMLVTILIVYTSAEIVWRERALRMAGILNASPVSNGVFVAAKCTALAVMVLLMTAVAVITGAILQLGRGWPIEPGALLAFVYFSAMPLILLAIAAVVIQTLSPHKYLGMLLVLLFAVVSQRGEVLGLNNPLWRFANAPGVEYSDMNGFGRTAPFHWFMLYWAAFAGLGLLLAIARWRGTQVRVHRPVAITLALIFVATGAFIYANTNTHDMLAWRAEYEKKYKPFQSLPRPRISAIKATVDLYPSARRYRVRGEYVLLNETAKPVDKVLVALRRGEDPTTLALDPPLAPRGRRTVRFDVTHENRDFVAPDQTIVENGSYITSIRALPAIGYRAGWEIDDPRERRRRGLPPSTPRPESEIPIAEWVDVDLTVSTETDQTVVAPGTLVRDWKEATRRFFHYRTAAPIPNQFAISSARYTLSKQTHDGVAIELYHHPRHTPNIERMTRAAADSLRYYRDNFGPYAHPHLRIAEVPIPMFSAFAQPGVLFFGENRGFLIDARDERRIDLVYRRVAHEIAHQWFGYTLIPADVPGASTLAESLTKYAELMVLKKAHGREQVGQSLAYELDLYLSGRTTVTGAEPPVVKAESDQPFLFYRKGAIVLYAIEELLGEQTMNAALRNLIREQGGPNHKPTTAHLLQHLHAVAKPEERKFIDEWLNDVVLYDVKLESAVANGSKVTLRVSASKERANGERLPFDEMLEIAVGDHVAKYRVKDGTQEIKVRVAGEAHFAEIDPLNTRVDRNRFDNGRVVTQP